MSLVGERVFYLLLPNPSEQRDQIIRPLLTGFYLSSPPCSAAGPRREFRRPPPRRKSETDVKILLRCSILDGSPGCFSYKNNSMANLYSEIQSEQSSFRRGQDMVLKKRSGYGSRGRQVCAMPHVPTLAPVKRFTRRKKNDMYALHLLATVAGMLSADQEDSSSRPNINGTAASYTTNRKSVKSEQFDEVPLFESIALGKDCCKGCIVSCAGVCAFRRETNVCLAENSSTQNVADAVLDSLTEKPDVLVNGSLVSCTKPCQLGHGLGTIPGYGTIGVCRPWSKRSAEVKQVHRGRPTMIRSQVDVSTTTVHSSVDTMDLDTKPPSVVSSDGSSGVHLGGHDKGHYSSALCWGEVHHVADRDDDENSSRCVHPSTSGSKGGNLPHCIGDCRTRRLFGTRFRKAARNKICGEMSSKARSTSFCMGDQDPPLASGGYHVKLTIKSFNVPELLIEIPENATVGSLKKIVMDTVTSTIEGSLHVGVLLQGKIIRDDNKPLHQAGIHHGAKLDNIGFTLECEAEQDSHPSVIAPEETDSIGASVVEPLSAMKCEVPFLETRIGDDNRQPVRALPNCTLNDPGDYPFKWTAQETATLVPLSKSKMSDFGQRRKRMPFCIAEVEALVEAVEQFGTGRWRDVKFHAFGTADHRTYVDLKDKWKNLVHTASIAPELRRGKAIPPQELLDRVLVAQAYLSLQQAKPQDNPPAPEICPA